MDTTKGLVTLSKRFNKPLDKIVHDFKGFLKPYEHYEAMKFNKQYFGIVSDNTYNLNRENRERAEISALEDTITLYCAKDNIDNYKKSRKTDDYGFLL